MSEQESHFTKHSTEKVFEKLENNSSLLRGALKIDASTSTSDITAGIEFSIYVVIRNPFPVPVIIYSTETHIPVELSDEIWRWQERDKRYQDFKRKLKMLPIEISSIKGINNIFQKMTIKFEFFADEIIRFLRKERGPRVAVAVSPLTLKGKEYEGDDLGKNVDVRDIEIGGEKNSLQIVQGSSWDLNFSDMSSEEIRNVLWDINEYIEPI